MFGMQGFPANQLGIPKLLKVARRAQGDPNLTINTTTEATAIELLKTGVIVTGPDALLLVEFVICGLKGSSVSTPFYIIYVDGVMMDRFYKSESTGFGMDISWKAAQPIAPGGHTVQLKSWIDSGNWQLNTATDVNHRANMFIWEVPYSGSLSRIV